MSDTGEEKSDPSQALESSVPTARLNPSRDDVGLSKAELEEISARARWVAQQTVEQTKEDPRGRRIDAIRASILVGLIAALGAVVNSITAELVKEDPPLKECRETYAGYVDDLRDPGKIELILPGRDGKSIIPTASDAIRCGLTVQQLEESARSMRITIK